MQVQINFTNKFLVSANQIDMLKIEFKQIDLFISSDKQTYLFPNDKYATLFAPLPAQYPSVEMAKVFTAIGEVVTYGTPIVIVITLVVQIIAKKVITSMWVFYSALQLAILICKNSNI